MPISAVTPPPSAETGAERRVRLFLASDGKIAVIPSSPPYILTEVHKADLLAYLAATQADLANESAAAAAVVTQRNAASKARGKAEAEQIAARKDDVLTSAGATC